MIIPIKINDFLNQLKKLGFHFNLILKKASGSEPLVVSTLPMEEVREIVSQELTTQALNLASSSLNSPEMSEMETSGAGTETPSPPNLSELQTSKAGLSASTPVLDVPLIRKKCQ